MRVPDSSLTVLTVSPSSVWYSSSVGRSVMLPTGVSLQGCRQTHPGYSPRCCPPRRRCAGRSGRLRWCSGRAVGCLVRDPPPLGLPDPPPAPRVLDTLGDLTDLVGNPSEGTLTLLAVLCAFRHFFSLLESIRFPVAAVLSADLRVY